MSDEGADPIYEREGTGLEFDRVAFFTDAVYAIAFTLLVVEVGIPELAEGLDTSSASNLYEALLDKGPVLGAFFLGCLVIGFYWAAHHRFMSRVQRADRRLVVLTVPYLAFVALLPFPTSMLGKYPGNPVSVIAFALNMAAVSTMEAVLLWHCGKAKLLSQTWPPAVLRWAVLMSLSPVLAFLVSIPVAFISTWLALACWGLTMPVQVVLDRRRPPDSNRYFT